MNLIKIIEDEPKVSSEILATGAELQHKSVIKQIDKYLPRLEKYGKVSFEMTSSKSGQKIKAKR